MVLMNWVLCVGVCVEFVRKVCSGVWLCVWSVDD